MSYKSVWDFGRAGKANYSVHKIGEYPSKIRPMVFANIVERFSKEGDVILDPFCGCGTLAVEAKLQGRSSINYDVNSNAIELTKKKLAALDKKEMISATKGLIRDLEKDFQTVLGNGDKAKKSKLKQIQAKKEAKRLEKRLKKISDDNSCFHKSKHKAEVHDARKLNLNDESIDSVITDIPYASMIKYSDLGEDLSTIEDYGCFTEELAKSFKEIVRVLKKGSYCVIFTADYRVGAARRILPVHSDVIQIMQKLGLVLFDTYIWRYYRSGGFRPFGAKPFQAMNVHTYILVFYKPEGHEKYGKKNNSVRYRKRLIEKMNRNKDMLS
jgi:DNA modification methylase